MNATVPPCLLLRQVSTVIFYRAMLHRARLCHSKSSVGLSVTLRYVLHKIISRPISLKFWLGLIPTWAIWCNGNTPKLGWNRGGVMSAKTCNISETVRDYYTVILSPSSAFQWSQNAWPWMTSKRDLRCFVLALALDAPALTRFPCFDTCGHLQRRRAVLPAIARLSCHITYF